MKAKTLSRRSFWLAFSISFAVFLFTDRLFENPFHIDASIFLSYLVIPPLVVGLLMYEKRMSFIAFVVDVVELTCVKFCVTYVLATVLWAISDGPPKPPAAPPPPPYVKEVKPVTVIDDQQTANIVGKVVDESGVAVAGALVFVQTGLEEMIFEVPTSTVVLTHDGQGFKPALTVAQIGQPVHTRSTDGTLHTMLGNYPFLAEAHARTINFNRPLGIVRLTCGVHPKEPGPPAHLAVLANPFSVRTDKNGRFELEGVPALPGRSIGLAMWHVKSGKQVVQAELRPGETRTLDFSM